MAVWGIIRHEAPPVNSDAGQRGRRQGYKDKESKTTAASEAIECLRLRGEDWTSWLATSRGW